MTELTANGDASASGAATIARRPVRPTAVAVNRPAARGAYRTHAMTARTGITAHAVVFIAQAMASTAPARISLPRPAQASVRQVSAMIGGSVSPTESGNAMIGEATASALNSAARFRHCPQSRTRCGEAMTNAAMSAAAVVSVVQIRGSPSTPERPADAGRPNSCISGRYGL